MKRILSIILVICLLSSTAILFNSCGKKEISFENGYNVIYAADASDSMSAQVTAFASSLEAKTDSDIDLKKIKADAALEDAGEYEILVGNTNRPETAKALKKIKDHGYIIAVYGKKIVIVGTTNLLTCLALDCFTESFLSGEDTVSSLSVEKIEVEKLEMLEFTNKWAFIHSPYLDGERDYINGQITELKAKLGGFSDVRGTAMQMIADSKTAEQEILVGIVNREEAKSFMSGMDANNYGIGARNGKLLISALNDGMIQKAFVLFQDALRDSVCVIDEEERIFLPADFTQIYTDTANKTLITDFPRPEGLVLSGTIDVHDGSMQYYYEGDGVNANAYDKYCKALEAAGYTVYTDSTAENSIFRTYINREKNITLYVAYNDFKHAEKQETSHKKAIRIVAASLDSVNLIEQELLNPDFTYGATTGSNKIQNSAITAIRLSYGESTDTKRIWGNFYVVSLEDGSFILLDGGVGNTTDKKRVYDVLLDLYKRADHATDTPTQEDPIRIAAWYLSHGHGDHYGNMASFMKEYCANYTKYCVTVDRLIANFASDEEHYNSEGGNDVDVYNTTVRDNLATYSSYVSDAPGEEGGFDYIKVHTGQKFWLGNIELNVMYTHEDQYPRQIHVYNNTSTAIRMSMYHTTGGVVSENSETTVLWTGDAQTDASAWMRATYGEALQSDMVQIAHHGGNGCEWEFYQLVAPTCAWWPHSVAGYKNYHNPASKGSTLVSYKVNYQLTSLQYVILSDICNYTVNITANGANYATTGTACIFSAGDNNQVQLGNVAEITSTGFMKTKHNKS